MITLVDYKATIIPSQQLIAALLGSAGPATLVSSRSVDFVSGNFVVRVFGEDLAVSDGRIVAGTIQAIGVAEAGDFLPFPFPDPVLLETSADALIAPIIYDPRITYVYGLDWSATRFDTLLRAAENGNPDPMHAALTQGGVVYQDSYYDNIAEGGNGADLFRDLSGSDHYDGGRNIDTLTYEFSSLDPGFILLSSTETYDPVGITADLRAGTVQTIGYPPPVFIADSDAEPDRPVMLHIDRIESIENLTGSAFNDRILGDARANTLRGLNGDDVIWGRGGRDSIDGGDGNDRLAGGPGQDAIVSGDGRDFLSGGRGADDFVFAFHEDGYNVIRDFDPVRDDIELNLVGSDLSIRQVGGNVVIRHADDLPAAPPPGFEPSRLTVVVRDTLVDELVEGENLFITYAADLL